MDCEAARSMRHSRYPSVDFLFRSNSVDFVVKLVGFRMKRKKKNLTDFGGPFDGFSSCFIYLWAEIILKTFRFLIVRSLMFLSKGMRRTVIERFLSVTPWKLSLSWLFYKFFNFCAIKAFDDGWIVWAAQHKSEWMEIWISTGILRLSVPSLVCIHFRIKKK